MKGDLKAQLATEARLKEDTRARVAQLEAVTAEAAELRSSLSKLSSELAAVSKDHELSQKQEGKLTTEAQGLKAAQQQLKQELQQVLEKKRELEEELEREKRRGDNERESGERLAKEECEKRAVLDRQLEMSAREIDRLQTALATSTSDCERREKDGNEAVARARHETLNSRHKVSELEEQLSSLTGRLDRSERELRAAVGERQAALSTNTELRTALSDSLQQIRDSVTSQPLGLPVGQAASSSYATEKGVPPTPPLSPPSPAPLDTAALQALLERAQAADCGSPEPLASLQGSLASFKQELSSLQDAVHRSTQRYSADPSIEAELNKTSKSQENEKRDG